MPSSLDHAVAALEAARLTRNPDAIAEALVGLAEATPLFASELERIGWTIIEAQELVSDGGGEGMTHLERRAALRMAEVLLKAGSSTAAATTARVVAEAAEDAGDPEHEARAGAIMVRAFAPAHTPEAEQLIDATEPTGAHEPRWARAHAAVHRARGEWAQVRELLTAALAGDSDPAADDAYEDRLGLGEANLLLGELDGANVALEAACGKITTEFAPHEWIAAQALRAVRAAQAGDAAACAYHWAQALDAAKGVDRVWKEGEDPRGGQVLWSIAGAADAGQAVSQLIAACRARGAHGMASDYVVGAMAIGSLMAAASTPADGAEVLEQLGTVLVELEREDLAPPILRLQRALVES